MISTLRKVPINDWSSFTNCHRSLNVSYRQVFLDALRESVHGNIVSHLRCPRIGALHHSVVSFSRHVSVSWMRKIAEKSSYWPAVYGQWVVRHVSAQLSAVRSSSTEYVIRVVPINTQTSGDFHSSAEKFYRIPSFFSPVHKFHISTDPQSVFCVSNRKIVFDLADRGLMRRAKWRVVVYLFPSGLRNCHVVFDETDCIGMTRLEYFFCKIAYLFHVYLLSS